MDAVTQDSDFCCGNDRSKTTLTLTILFYMYIHCESK